MDGGTDKGYTDNPTFDPDSDTVSRERTEQA